MKMKKTIAFLFGLTITLQSAALSAFAEEISSPDEMLPEEEPALTEVIPHLYEAPYTLQEAVIAAELPDAPAAELPASFDLRKEGLVSPIRNQGELGTCWAHATLGCIETDRIKDEPYIDLSERCLATLITSEEYGDCSNDFMKGSNSGEALGLLSNWIGIISESAAPYDEEYTIDRSREELQQQSEKHVTNVRYFSYYDEPRYTPNEQYYVLYPERLQAIKQEICSGHALYAAMNFDDDNAVSSDTHALYNDPDNTVPDYPHAVLLVGYDDQYSAENFLVSPPGDGAWLVKNSWGTDHGDIGYYWVSYYDQTINEVVTIEAVSAEQHDRLYSYDDFGASGCFAAAEEGDESICISNIYTAEENGFITDVMLFNAVAGDQYEISVYTDLADEAVPTSGEAHTGCIETLPHPGYHTVTLPEPVHVNAGERFAVTAKITGKQGYHIMCEYAARDTDSPVGFSRRNNDAASSTQIVLENRILETFGNGQSFFSTDGQNWTDLYDSYESDEYFLTGNICLRAITAAEGKIQFSAYNETLAPGTDITLSCADGTDIYYSVDGGAYQLYTAPVRFTKEMTLSAYAEGEEDNIYTQHYAEKKAGFSCLLVQTSEDSYYIDPAAAESDIIIPWSADSCTLYPITAGTVTNGKTVTGSYEPIVLECGLEPCTYTLTCKEDGLKPTKHLFHISRQCEEHFMEGVWKPTDESMVWYYFGKDGKSGYYVDRISGKKTKFTYSVKDHVLTMTAGKKVRTAKIASDLYNALLNWSDGTSETLMFMYPEETAPFYSNPEFCAFAEAYTASAGRKPAEVRAEIGEWGNVIVTVKTESGEEIVYTVNEGTAIGTDQDGTVVILNELPENDPVTEIKAGIWAFSYNGSVQYYYFDENGSDCGCYSTYDGSYYTGSYRLESDQLHLNFGEFDNRQAAVRKADDMLILVYPYGYSENMTYITDAGPDTFTFITDRELQLLSQAYYETAACVNDQFDCVMCISDRLAMAYSNDGNVWYQIDRLTGRGFDQENNEIDLRNPAETPGEPLPAGIWFSRDADFMLFGYYIFYDDGKTGRFIDNITGAEETFTYRRIGSNGIAYTNDEKQHFTFNEMGPGFVIAWAESNICPYDSMITLKEDKPRAEFKVYTVQKLMDMTRTDFERKTGNDDTVIEITGYNEEGDLILSVIDPETGSMADQYILNPEDGTGKTQEGETVNLPQTGNNSLTAVMTVFAALMLTGFGFFAMKYSGTLRRKEEE